MTRKSAEPSFATLAGFYKWHAHKFGDVRYCPACHIPLPKSEMKPDYLLAPIYTWIECKNSDSFGRWPWASDIGPEGKRQKQRDFLDVFGGWLFIVLGNQPAPKGKMAWLYAWGKWKGIETALLAIPMKSLKLTPSGKPTDRDYQPPANVILDDVYRLEWVRGSGWTIPNGHPWWTAYRTILQNQLTLVSERTTK